MKKMEYIERALKAEGYSGPITGFSECKKCGGLCCLRNACGCSVMDFEEITVESVEKILDTGKYMITAALERKRAKRGIPIEVIPYISAREINVPENGILISMLRSRCAMLGKNGCNLSIEERPTQGLMLIPLGKDACKCYMDTPIDQWRPYKEILDEVIKIRTHKTAQEIFEEELIPLAKDLKYKIQMSMVISGEPISYAEYNAAKAMDLLGVFYGLFPPPIGEVMHDFVNRVNVTDY